MRIVFEFTMAYRVLSLCILLFTIAVFQLPQVPEVQAEDARPYLSQEFVDTMVQSAYYNFVSASEFSAEERRQAQAIAHAKKVAARLKRMAKGDPNRRYVLWRVAELEHQIFLEEEELFLKKLYKMQKEINILCDKFNAEVGKWRPNFTNLIAIHSRMLKLSPRKANELSWLIENRDRNISREVSYSLERALLARDYEKAKKEYEYIRKNRKYLLISDSKYASFERRMRVKEEADDMVANIDTYLNEIRSIIRKNDLADARRNIECLQGRLKEVRTFIPYKKYSQFYHKIRKLSEKVTHMEDSLVIENLELVHARRVDAAIDYLDKVLRKSGVSNDKIVMVDKAIMEMPGHRRSAVDSKVDQELLAFTNTTTQKNGFSFGDVQAKVQAKMDSVRAVQEEQARLERIAWEKEHKHELAAKRREEEKRAKYRKKTQKIILKIYTLLEANKVKKANDLFNKQRPSLEKYASKDEFANLKAAVIQANEALTSAGKKEQKSRQKAHQVTEEIYTLLRQKEVEAAYSKFQNLRKPLQRYSSDGEFHKLETAVYQAYESFKLAKRRDLAQRQQQEQQQQRLQREQQARRVEQEKRSAAVPEEQQARRVEQEQRHAAVPAPSVATAVGEPVVASSVNEDPYAAFDKKQAEAQDKATQDVMEIYTLLERNQIVSAYKFFKKKQIPLKTYICKEAYEVLESTVVDAYKSHIEAMQ